MSTTQMKACCMLSFRRDRAQSGERRTTGSRKAAVTVFSLSPKPRPLHVTPGVRVYTGSYTTGDRGFVARLSTRTSRTIIDSSPCAMRRAARHNAPPQGPAPLPQMYVRVRAPSVQAGAASATPPAPCRPCRRPIVCSASHAPESFALPHRESCSHDAALRRPSPHRPPALPAGPRAASPACAGARSSGLRTLSAPPRP